MAAPLGIRNNNPLNLRYVGQPGAAQGERGFAAFETPDHGLRAASAQLKRYWTGATTGQPLRTVRDIIGTWAPPSENDTGAYVRNVAAKIGVKPDDPLSINTDKEQRAKLIKAMADQEVGPKHPFGVDTILAALNPIRSAQAAEPTPAPAPSGLQPGTIREGKGGVRYEFAGGNPKDKASWRPVDAAPAEDPAQPAAPAFSGIGKTIGDFGRSAVDAVTFGLADEARAAGAATGDALARTLGMPNAPVGTWGEGYDRALAEERKKNADMGIVPQIAGGLVGGLASAPRAVAGAVSSLPRWLRPIIEGAGFGAAYGAGSGEGGIEGRAGGAAIGAGIGGAVGAAVPVVTWAVRGVRNALNPTTAAQTRLAEALTRDGTAPADIPAAVRALGPEATIVDAAGPNVRGMARAVANLPGEGRDLAETAIAGRAQAQPERTTAAIQQQFGAGEDWHVTFNALDAARRQAARPLYDQAYAAPVTPTAEMTQILQTDAGRKAMDRAARIASNEGVDLSQVPITDMRAWDYAKRGLDDVVEKYRDPTTGRLALDTEGRSVESVRSRLVAELDNVNPAYRTAREAWGGPTRAREAMQRGREFARRPAEITEQQITRLSPADRDFFRLGVARYLWEQAGTGTGANRLIRDTIGNRNFQRALRAVSPDAQAYGLFLDDMRRLATFRDTNAAMFGGSRTAVLAKEMDDVDGGMARDVVSAVTGSPSALAIRVGVKALDRVKLRLNERARNQLARMLFSTDPREQRAALAALRRIQRTSQAPTRALVPGATIAAVGAAK